MKMKDVLFVSGLKKNLLSISTLDSKGMRVSFLDGQCNTPDPPIDEEDATIHQSIQASSPMNMNIHTDNDEVNA